MKRILWIMAMAVMGFAACQDNEGPDYTKPAVGEAPDFIDSRDGKIYKCVEIGGQIWMAENLAYHVKGVDNNMDCRTWKEEIYNNPKDSVKVEGELLASAIKEAAVNGDMPDPMLTPLPFLPSYKKKFSEYFSWDPREGSVEQVFNNCLAVVAAEDKDKVPEMQVCFEKIEEGLVLEKFSKDLDAFFSLAEDGNGNYSGIYGLLYSLEGAKKAVPTEGGWRLPTDTDWKKLEEYLGMPEEEIEKSDTWRGTVEGEFLKKGEHGIGFDALYGGGKLYAESYSKWTDMDTYNRDGQNAYFWTSEKMQVNDSTTYGMFRSVAVFSEQILRSRTFLENKDKHPVLFSVRLVKDKE